MTTLLQRPSLPMLPMLLLAGLFLGACGGGGGDTPVAGTPSPNQQTTNQQIVAQLVQQGYLKASNTNADDRLDLASRFPAILLSWGRIRRGVVRLG